MKKYYFTMFCGIAIAILFLANLHFVNANCHSAKNKDGYLFPMYFTNNINIKFLFDSFQVRNMTEFIICNFICVLLGVLSLYIKLLKKNLDRKQQKIENAESMFLTYWNGDRIMYGLLFFLHYAVDYILMLIVMTFNSYIFLSIMIGLSSAYLFWGHLF